MVDSVDAHERLVALIALRRAGGRAWSAYIMAVRKAGEAGAVDPRGVLEGQFGLLSYEAVADAETELAAWQAHGYRVISFADADYPENLRVTEGRPPLLFVAGSLVPGDRRAVSVIGSREPSPRGVSLARDVAVALGAGGYTVVSGRASGIDTSALTAALAGGHRPLAVIGTGLDHAYPAANRELQDRIAASGAVLSQFWPEARATRQSFPMRNAVMSGLTLASVIVEAGANSGTRIQARNALLQRREVVLMEPVLEQPWARALLEKPGVHAVSDVAEVVELLAR